jgi:hypothetical protein
VTQKLLISAVTSGAGRNSKKLLVVCLAAHDLQSRDVSSCAQVWTAARSRIVKCTQNNTGQPPC